MVDARLKNAGYAGGEGCQWITCIAFGGGDGRLAVMGNDTGGIYRSRDAGATWEPATVGYNSRGAVAFAFDPHQPDRVLAVGSCGKTSGLFLSENGAETWRQVLPMSLKKSHDYRTQLGFDRRSRRAYWASLEKGLYRSEDGGATWTPVAGGDRATGSELAVGEDGRLYAGTQDGLWISSDCGETWRQALKDPVGSVCAPGSKACHGRVWALTTNALYVAESSSDDFVRIPSSLPQSAANNFRNLCVSPAEPNRMLMQDDTLAVGRGWSLDTWLTEDGGRTWRKAVFDRQRNVWAPYNPRPHTFAVSPTDHLRILSYDSDLVYASEDGGRSFACSSVGYNAILVSSVVQFNVDDPALVAVSAQDYNGALSEDNGKTWRYVNWSGKPWGGHVYGAYCLDRDTAVAGVSDKWRQTKGHAIRIAVTRDGGRTVTRTDYVVEGEPVACGARGDSRRVFFGEWISRDGAKTWVRMNGCTGVFCCDVVTGRLLGVNGQSIVWSDDNGETWSVALDRTGEKGKVASLAYDRRTGKVYFNFWSWSLHAFTLDASTTHPPVVEVMPGSRHVCGVAADPVDPSVVYAAAYADDHYTMENVWRSADGGKTWRGLCRQPGDGRQDPDGANQARGVTVNPLTREPFVSTHCCGLWRYAEQADFSQTQNKGVQ